MSEPNVSPLLTDLYQLTMVQGYLDQGMHDTAVFEFFVRNLPSGRNFLIAAGLEQVIDYLADMKFSPGELEWLSGLGTFSTDFIDYLESFSFTGDVHAVPEGTIFFQNEPLLRVTAPLPQAQIVETRIINLMHFETLVASKAVRSVLAGDGRLLFDFGLRRAHGAEAGILAARASFLAGFDGTSTVAAGRLYGIPTYGTMAHSFIQAHDTELEAFEHFALAQPDNVVLLLDTYDSRAAAEKTAELYPRLKEKGIIIKAVRLDSGDLVEESKAVRRILDGAGLDGVKIFASGDLDEYAVGAIVAAGAPIDGFGVGTRMVTSSDAPYLECAYKLVEYAGVARRKLSAGKATLPGRKQVYRFFNDEGIMSHDVLALGGESLKGRAMLERVMEDGRRPDRVVPLEEIREYVKAQIDTIPEPLRALGEAPRYPVELSAVLRECRKDE